MGCPDDKANLTTSVERTVRIGLRVDESGPVETCLHCYAAAALEVEKPFFTENSQSTEHGARSTVFLFAPRSAAMSFGKGRR